MKTYKHLYDNMLNHDVIDAAIEKAAQHKKKRSDVQDVLEHKEDYNKKIYGMLEKREYIPKVYQLHRIVEGSNHKIRYIEKPHFKYDQLVQHVVLTQLKPIVMKGMYEHAHGAIENRGPLQTAKVISKWLRNDKSGTRYCLQMDVHHCYPSINQEILVAKWHRVIKDDEFNKLNDAIIRSCRKGLALGAPTSQWHEHFLFQDFDHWVPTLDGVSHYIRHVDDIIVFSSNKRKLRKVRDMIIQRLHDELELEMNHNHQVFAIEWTDKNGNKHGRPLDVCGYLFYRNKRILRKSRMLGITRKANKIGKKEKPTFYDCEQMISQMGWLKHSDSYDMYLEYIKPKVTKRQMTHTISRVQKKKNKEAKERSENHGIQVNSKLLGDQAVGS